MNEPLPEYVEKPNDVDELLVADPEIDGLSSALADLRVAVSEAEMGFAAQLYTAICVARELKEDLPLAYLLWSVTLRGQVRNPRRAQNHCVDHSIGYDTACPLCELGASRKRLRSYADALWGLKHP